MQKSEQQMLNVLSYTLKKFFLSYTPLYLYSLLLSCLVGFSHHTPYCEKRLRATQASSFIKKSQMHYKKL